MPRGVDDFAGPFLLVFNRKYDSVGGGWHANRRQHTFGIGGVLVMKSVIIKRVLCLIIFMGGALAQRTYTTKFPKAETPLSENHNWINQGTCADSALCRGAGGSNINSSTGVAHGTQSGAAPPPYLDSGAIVGGAWGPSQMVRIVVNWDGNGNTNNNYDETEIRLRNTFSNGHGQGYNINCRTGTPNSNSYVQMGRFNPNGTFTSPFAQASGKNAGCTNGDVLTGAVVNNARGQPVISFYRNGVLIIQGTDTGGAAAIQSGSPGFGFYHQCASQPCGGSNGSNTDFGISSFFASDLAPPSGLTAVVH
jgi:hypothetical protein